MIERVGLGHKFVAWPHQFSSGEQQCGDCARSPCNRSLCFATSTSALDPKLVIEVVAVVTELAVDGTTC